MTQRAVCSFPNALFNLCSFVPTALNLSFKQKIEIATCYLFEAFIEFKAFDHLVAFVIILLDEQLRKFSHPPSPWLIGIFLMSSSDRCIGPEKDFFIQSPTSLVNDFQAVFGPDMPKAQTS